MTNVILCGGSGTRLWSISNSFNTEAVCKTQNLIEAQVTKDNFKQKQLLL